MEISNDVLCFFSAQVKEQDGSYVVELPQQEIELGDVTGDERYRVAVVETGAGAAPTDERDPVERSDGPPVAEGERRTVDIVDIGEQGDGIARVERGYVLIVPETEMHERVTVRITDVKENLAFSEVVERSEYYE